MMQITSHRKAKPNWLLRGLIIPSVCLHLLIFSHITGLYHSDTISCIELTLKNISKPEARSIPRPRHRPDPKIRPATVEQLKMNRSVQHRIEPIHVEPADKTAPDSLVEALSPENPVSGLPGLQVGQWQAGPVVSAPDFGTAEDYFDMVRLRIEQYKRYPESAQNRHIEGRVTVEFVIEPDGTVSSAHIKKGSRHDSLNEAALRAIKKAAPFPIPPSYIFTQGQPVRLVLAVVFELT